MAQQDWKGDVSSTGHALSTNLSKLPSNSARSSAIGSRARAMICNFSRSRSLNGSCIRISRPQPIGRPSPGLPDNGRSSHHLVHNPLAITVSVDVQFASREQPQLFRVELLKPLKLTRLATFAAFNTNAG